MDSGTTWSRVSVGRLNCWPQYMHRWASRANRAGLVRFGVGSIARERAWPRAAMIGCRSMPLCRPLKRLVPPWMCRQGSPSVGQPLRGRRGRLRPAGDPVQYASVGIKREQPDRTGAMQRRGVGRCFGARSRKRSSGFDQTQACSVCLHRENSLYLNHCDLGIALWAKPKSQDSGPRIPHSRPPMAGWDAHAFLLSPAPSARPLTRGLFPEGFRWLSSTRGVDFRSRELSEAGRCGLAGPLAPWARGMPRAGWAGRPNPGLAVCAGQRTRARRHRAPGVRALCLRSTASQAPERPAASGWAGPRSGVYGVSCQPTPPRHPPGSSCSYCGCRPAAGTTAGAGRQPGSGAEALVVHCHQRGGAGLMAAAWLRVRGSTRAK